jgi:hypothetical protein
MIHAGRKALVQQAAPEKVEDFGRAVREGGLLHQPLHPDRQRHQLRDPRHDSGRCATMAQMVVFNESLVWNISDKAQATRSILTRQFDA